MPATTCERCQKTIEFTDAQAGKRLPCPFCGDVNVLPGGSAEPAVDRAAAKGYPPASGPEAPVMKVHQAMFGAKPFSFLVLWIGFGGGLLAAAVLPFLAMVPIALVCGGVSLLCGVTLLIWRLARRARTLEITTRRIVDRQGMLARQVNEVLIRDIRDIRVTQSFVDRLLGIGAVSISTAGPEDNEIVVKEIPKPDRVREVLNLYRNL